MKRLSRTMVSSAAVRARFEEAAANVGRDELGTFIANGLGWTEFDSSTPSVRGVLVALGIEPDRTGVKREVLREYRAEQITVLIRLAAGERVRLGEAA